MTEYAQIEVTSHEIPSSPLRYRTYKWLGDKRLPIEISWNVDIKELPFKLRQIDTIPYRGVRVFIRQDVYFPYGLILEAKIKLSNAWKWFFYRFMWTLNIWGLAYTPPGCVPSWRDIGKK